MMGKRFNANLLIFLVFLSLFGVGFASWNVTDNYATGGTSGTIVVDDVLKFNDYIQYVDDTGQVIDEIEIFDFYKTGFVDEHKEVVTTGHIKFNLKIDMARIKQKFSNSENIIFELTLRANQMVNLFNNTQGLQESVKATLIYQSATSEITVEETKSDTVSKIEFICPNIYEEEVTVKFDYTFEIIDVEIFKTNVYPVINNPDFNLSLSVKFAGNE